MLKSTGDVVAGRALYEGYATVTDAPPECFLTLRDTVLLRKESRKLIVQPNTRLEGNGCYTIWWSYLRSVQRADDALGSGRAPSATLFRTDLRPRTLAFSISHTYTGTLIVRQQQEVSARPTK